MTRCQDLNEEFLATMPFFLHFNAASVRKWRYPASATAKTLLPFLDLRTFSEDDLRIIARSDAKIRHLHLQSAPLEGILCLSLA